MYERAADDGPLRPLWHVSGATTFFAGPLQYNAGHQHGAPVFLAGLYGDFRLRVGAEGLDHLPHGDDPGRVRA